MTETVQATADPAGQVPRQPVGTAERITSLDFIRGIAVLGILFPNIVAFGQPLTAYFWPHAMDGGMTGVDGHFWLFQFIALDGKFRGLFSLLFGAGVYLFMEKAWARGAGRGLQLRRLALLLCFGLIHYFLIWHGDILTIYAVWGMVSLLMVKWQARTQWRVGLILSIVGSLLMSSLMLGNWAAGTIPAVAEQMGPEAAKQVAEAEPKALKEAAAESERYRTGSYAEIVTYRVTREWGMLVQQVLIVGPLETLGLMLMGMGLYRRGLFSGGMDAAALRKWGWAGVVTGTVLTAAIALWPYVQGLPFWTTMLVFQGLGALPHIIMVLGLVCLLALWAPTALQTGLGRRFAAAGQMAFSNYLGTSILMMFVFHGWAGGLFGQLHRPGLLLVVLAVWALMLVWSPWWLARFRMGPLEWLWRCLTYGRLFPLRKQGA